MRIVDRTNTVAGWIPCRQCGEHPRRCDSATHGLTVATHGSAYFTDPPAELGVDVIYAHV